jgi:hypothetical protein
VLMLRREQFIMFMQSRPQVILAVLQFLARRVRYVTEVVETSITWASHVAEGKYEEARKVGALAPSRSGIVMKVDTVTIPAAAAQPVAVIGASIPLNVQMGETTMKLGGAFSMIASALEQREQTMTKKFTEAGLTATELAELANDDQRTIMKFLVGDEIAATQGITFDILQAKFAKIHNMAEILEALHEDHWIVKSGAEPNLRYRPNLRRKH